MGTLQLPSGKSLLAASGRKLLAAPFAAPGIVDIYPGSHPSDIAGLSGWWDAGQLLSAASAPNMLSPTGVGVTSWLQTIGSLVDKSGGSHPMTVPSSSYNGARYPTGIQNVPRLVNALGGLAGQVNLGSGIIHPFIDYTSTSYVGGSWDLSSGQNWTIHLVCSRPNLIQETALGSAVLLSVGGLPILSVSNSGTNATGDTLTVFSNPAIADATLNSFGMRLSRRWTHSFTITNIPGVGIQLWVDDTIIGSGISHPFASLTGALTVCGNGSANGSAQMYFHEMAIWTNKTFSGAESAQLISSGTSVSKRWQRGQRRGGGMVMNGQSNSALWYGAEGSSVSGNYLTSGAGTLREGLRYYLGLLSLNLYYFGNGGHPLYDATGGQFYNNAGGGAPSTWPQGTDAINYGNLAIAMTADQRADMMAGIVFWGEADSALHGGYANMAETQGAYARLMADMRAPFGKTAAQMPIFMCSQLCYGLVDANGNQKMREIGANLIATAGLNVQMGFVNTADVAAASSVYDASTGIDTGGPQRDLPNQAAHSDQQSYVQLSRRACGPFARAILASGYTDLYSSLPAGIAGYGPRIDPVIAPALSGGGKIITVTIQHDIGTDFLTAAGAFPLQGKYGDGWGVMDGGAIGTAATNGVVLTPRPVNWGISALHAVGDTIVNGGNIYVCASLTGSGYSAAAGPGPAGVGSGIVDNQITWNYVGPLVPAVTRISGNQIQIALPLALANPAAACKLFYSWPFYRIGFGNAIYDNAASIAQPAGWDICADLGWPRFGYPIQTPPYGVALTAFTSTPATAAVLASPALSWVQAGNALPAMAVTLTGGNSGYAQLSRFGVAEGAAVPILGSGAIAGLPIPSRSQSTYTIKIYSDAGLGTLIGESAPIGVWTAAAGPASAALTINSGSVPATPVSGNSYTVTGTAVTANNYILFGMGQQKLGTKLCVPVDSSGNWSITTNWPLYYGNVYATDMTTGLSVTATTAIQSAATGPAVYFYGDGSGLPAFTSLSVPGTSPGYFAACHYGGTVTLTNGGGLLDLANYGRLLGGLSPAPGTYTLTFTVSGGGFATVTNYTVTVFVPFAYPPTDATVAIATPLVGYLPRHTAVGQVSSRSGAGFWTCYILDPSYSFVVPDTSEMNVGTIPGNAIASPDQRSIMTKYENTPPGSYPITIVITEGSVTYSKSYTIVVAPGTVLLAAAAISYTPPGSISNLTALGTNLGSLPTVAGMTGPVTWWITQDRGYRTNINPSTGQMSIAKFFSAVTGSETFTLACSDGTSICKTTVTIPVASPAGPTLRVGPGQTYSTIQAAINVFASAPTTTYANSTIEIHYGTYLDDVGVTGTYYLYGPVKFIGVPDPTTGNLPLITYTLYNTGVRLIAQKGVFNICGYDFWLENIEISNARLNARSGSYNFAVQAGDTASPDTIAAMYLKNVIIHDCDDGPGRGHLGCRWYIYNSVIAYTADGTGFDHGMYLLGGLGHVENCLIYGGSNGHLIKSRTDVTEIINCNIISTNDSSPGALIDIPDGGDLTITGCNLWHGPNAVNAHCIQYGAELGPGSIVHIGIGDIVTVSNVNIYSLVRPQNTWYAYGHVPPSGLVNTYAVNTKNQDQNRGPGIFTATNVAFYGLTSGNAFGIGPVVSYGTFQTSADQYSGPWTQSGVSYGTDIPPYNSLLQAANWPLTITVAGFTDTHVGPTLGFYSDVMYTGRDALGNSYTPITSGQGISVLWGANDGHGQAPIIPHGAPIGTIIGSATTYTSSLVGWPENTLPITYSLIWTQPAFAGLVALSSTGVLTLASSAAAYAGKTVTIAFNARTAYPHDNPELMTFWIS